MASSRRCTTRTNATQMSEVRSQRYTGALEARTQPQCLPWGDRACAKSIERPYSQRHAWSSGALH